jgi:hypothetical protein
MKGSQVRQVVQHPTGALKLWYFFVANMPSGATRRSIERCGGSNNLREVVVCDDEDDRDYPTTLGRLRHSNSFKPTTLRRLCQALAFSLISGAQKVSC